MACHTFEIENKCDVTELPIEEFLRSFNFSGDVQSIINKTASVSMIQYRYMRFACYTIHINYNTL